MARCGSWPLTSSWAGDWIWTLLVVLKGPLIESVCRYELFDQIWVRGGFVVFNARGASPAIFLPVEVIPSDDWLRHIWSKLAQPEA